jgi:hypothetical protein
MIVGCYFYSLENCLIDMTVFNFCYNSYKHAPDQDSSLGRIFPCGPMQLLGPWAGRVFVASISLMNKTYFIEVRIHE